MLDWNGENGIRAGHWAWIEDYCEATAGYHMPPQEMQDRELERIVEEQVARLVSDKEPKPPDSSTGRFANELELTAWEAASDEALEGTEADANTDELWGLLEQAVGGCSYCEPFPEAEAALDELQERYARLEKDHNVMADGLISCQKQLRKVVLEKNGVFDEVE
jgi:hypothetical protein